MSVENFDINVAAPTADGSGAVATLPPGETPARQPNGSATPEPPEPQSAVLLTPTPQVKESSQSPGASATQPITPEKTSYQNFNAGDSDPLVGVKIEEVLIKADGYFVYIDQDLILRWHWNAAIDPDVAAPIFNRQRITGEVGVSAPDSPPARFDQRSAAHRRRARHHVCDPESGLR
ncbi:MAG: hypothetical protein JOZ60_13080 [Verrucomicrobia bacterium]|nr:hypothetical protein [Verrucomicrobiota bacterium]